MGKLQVGYAVCGSFCTLRRSLEEMRKLADEVDIIPIASPIVTCTDSRFGTADEFMGLLRSASGREPITTVQAAEPIGPKGLLDVLVIAPCTGNTLAKMAQGITDSAVTMAAKAHLRCDRPTLIALASNDSMSANLANIATLLGRKQVFFVPMRQDDPEKKPHSLVADFTYLPECLTAALAGHQLRPLFL